jgi:hypothetical protein
VTVHAQLKENDYLAFLLKALGAGLVFYIALAQLGSALRFGHGGPRLLAPASVSASILAGILFGLSHGNLAYTSIQLRTRLDRSAGDPKRIEKTSRVPNDVNHRIDWAKGQMTVGIMVAAAAVALYLSTL